jgi:AraC-like DNA-binding protein
MRTIGTISATIEHIEANLGDELRLKTVADEIGYSHYYLHRMFTICTGLTMHDYILRRRLTEAAKLLVMTQQPIVEIALLSGFESQQAFTSAFKSMYKRTPLRFRLDGVFYPLQMRIEFDDAMFSENAGLGDEQPSISLAGGSDIGGWMRLMRLAIDGFPCLEENEHVDALMRHVSGGSAFIMRENDIATGIMMITPETGSIDFLAVHPLFRKRGVARALVARAIGEMLSHSEISITTYREGDRADTGYRGELVGLGFTGSELLVEFGYPTQKMVLSANRFRGLRHAE